MNGGRNYRAIFEDKSKGERNVKMAKSMQDVHLDEGGLRLCWGYRRDDKTNNRPTAKQLIIQLVRKYLNLNPLMKIEQTYFLETDLFILIFFFTKSSARNEQVIIGLKKNY